MTVNGKGRVKMLNIVLVEPEIPHNTGAIARTCAATGARLHLIRPLGFDISDKAVKRCGLDYWHLVDLPYTKTWTSTSPNGATRGCISPRQKRRGLYCEADLSQASVTLMFGKETAGLPLWLREKYRERCIRIPMVDEARSLNLSNSVAILAYEALRQQGFPGLQGVGEMALK